MSSTEKIAIGSILVGLVVLSLVLAQPDLDGESGNSTVRPDTVAAAQERQHLAAGQKIRPGRALLQSEERTVKLVQTTHERSANRPGAPVEILPDVI